MIADKPVTCLVTELIAEIAELSRREPAIGKRDPAADRAQNSLPDQADAILRGEEGEIPGDGTQGYQRFVATPRFVVICMGCDELRQAC